MRNGSPVSRLFGGLSHPSGWPHTSSAPAGGKAFRTGSPVGGTGSGAAQDDRIRLAPEPCWPDGLRDSVGQASVGEHNPSEDALGESVLGEAKAKLNPRLFSGQRDEGGKDTARDSYARCLEGWVFLVRHHAGFSLVANDATG